MNAPRLSNHLRLLFVLAVLVPCALLAFLAVRSIDREEAFLEKRLQGTLDSEVSHAVALIREDLDRIRDELGAAAPRDEGVDIRSSFAAWKKATPLVGVPFLLSSDFRILWPTRDSFFAPEDLAFLNWNRDFVTDAKPTPFYQNVALLYKDQIAEPAPSVETGGGGAAAPGKYAAAPLRPTMNAAPADKRVVVAAAPKAAEGKEEKPRIEDLRIAQQALAEFEQSDAVRKRVYDEAARKGQKAETRNVSPGAAGPPKSNAPADRPESIYISEPRKFSEITAGKDGGLIPRFIEDKLTLLFWKRLASGRIVGCLVADGAARARLLGRLPDVVSSARILTVLDENGRPLVTPPGQASRDWRRPLVAREVSEILPRWEAAAYLADPGAVATEARSTRLMMAVLILALFAVIAAAGAMILRTLRSEMVLARQKTTFVTNVSHELKTPLTSIRMFSEMLKDGRQPDAGKQRAYLGLMVAETERLTRLINNVLDFSRMEKGKRAYARRRLDLGVLAAAVVENERVRLEHDGFAVAFLPAPIPIGVEADEEALRQAVLNLLSNAEKYSGAAKSVEIEAGRTDRTVWLEVRDRGIGIPPAEASKIFREFYRVDRSLAAPVSGSGLGLTIARRIVRDHGGDIECRPRDGGGSIFRITLPEAEAKDRA
jgi:signal transduction histidine kinase